MIQWRKYPHVKKVNELRWMAISLTRAASSLGQSLASTSFDLDMFLPRPPACILTQLPMIYCIENNQYGMGTSKERSSSNNSYYTMGNHIPGLKLDGMNVLMVREVRAISQSRLEPRL